jgi:hypothetical protein
MSDEGPALTGLEGGPLSEITHHIERPTGQLRWRVSWLKTGPGEPVLEQAWEVITYGVRGPSGQSVVWRATPTVEDAALSSSEAES